MEGLVFLGKTLFYIFITPLIVYSLKFYALAFAGIFHRGRREESLLEKDLPSVSIHIPVYNDSVAVKCIKSCMEFDYPKHKYEIIVVDDSTDETTGILRKFQKKTKAFRLIHRRNRRGFKAGALNDALKESKGDIIVVFDSDYVLGRDFLKKIVQPFMRDEKVAFVQTRWDYLNPRKNRISRIAMMAYNAFHQCSMPVKEKLGTAIFCGTGGAVRKSVLVNAGGWNEDSIGEDLDLSIRILNNGWKQVYLPYVKARGEVPETFRAFVKQQERWAYGTTKAMKDYLGTILRSPNLTRKQKIDLVFITSGFLVFPFILGVTLSTIITLSPWFGSPAAGQIFVMSEFANAVRHAASDFFSLEGLLVLALTSGYIFECAVALAMQKRYRDMLYIPYIFVLGSIMQFTNTVAVLKALLGIKHSFYKTPKLYYNGTV